jgi:hypothetical protein
MNRPWFAIVWFMIWGVFQAYAVASIFAGTWQKPEKFPEEAYFSLIYPDMFFIPLYLLTVGHCKRLAEDKSRYATFSEVLLADIR